MDGYQDFEEDNQNAPLQVSEALALAKTALEKISLVVEGEVAEVKNGGWAFVYMKLKDEDGVLPAKMLTKRFEAMSYQPKVGEKIQITGKFSLYPKKGEMQFDIARLEPAGEGKLRAQVEAVRKKLEAEGLLAASRKRALPEFPERIGVVTSPGGAVIRDILRTLRRRFPLATLVFAGTKVEGVDAAAGMVSAMQEVLEAGCEAIIIGRGGGSFEDLMPFNDEALCRCIAASPVPVVTAIGHETDTCIADLVSDARASTPTAAAELLSARDEGSLRSDLTGQLNFMAQFLGGRLSKSQAVLDQFAERPYFKDPMRLFETDMQELDHLSQRLDTAIPNMVSRDEQTFEHCRTRMINLSKTLLEGPEHEWQLRTARLNDLSPLAVVARGYAMASTESGAIVRSVEQVKTGDAITVKVSDGQIAAQVSGITKENNETSNSEAKTQ